MIGGVYGKGSGSDLGYLSPVSLSHSLLLQIHSTYLLNGSNLFGFGISFNTVPLGQGVVDEIRQAIIGWAQRGGGIVQNLPRPNGFFNPNAIGAGGAKLKIKRSVDTGETELERRSRTDQCPNEGDLLRFATVDAPDVDIERDVRWGGTC